MLNNLVLVHVALIALNGGYTIVFHPGQGRYVVATITIQF